MTARLKVAALIDLLRSPQSGGHVKGWEKLAAATAENPDLPLDLTVYFSGAKKEEILAPHARIRQLPQVFSTARLKFLPYIPDHTDLSPWHPALARDLKQMDVIHTTDAYFAFARTAERLSAKHGKTLVNSFHTDVASYTRIFTTKTIEDIFGQGILRDCLIERWELPLRKQRQMEKRLREHLAHCKIALATRERDRAVIAATLGKDRTRLMRLGTDRGLFTPQRADRAAIEARYRIPQGRLIVVFVGRLDVGKNIYTLLAAMQKLVQEGLPLHLVTAGIGPAANDISAALPDNSTVGGFITPADMAALYASADIIALVSEVETRSMAMVESLASGLPVLVSQKSGLAQLHLATDAIREVAGGAPEWAEALRAFATDPALREKMKAAALHYGANHIAGWAQILAEDLLPAWQEAHALRAGDKAA